MSNKSDFVIRFVSTTNARKEQMQNAVKGVQAAKVPTEKVKEETVLQITTKDSNLYVCDPFEGPAFDHLLNLGCRVVGAQCVLSCLEMDMSLPRVNHPVHNISLFGAVITCSSVAKQQRESIHKKVQWMGGVVSKDLTECITHLIAGEVGSKKYHVAADLKKPILLPSWIDACWEEGQTKYIKGTKSELASFYKCPIFKGCNICVTGFQMDEKKKIEDAVTENGGIYSKELKFQESTHLIVRSAKGAKYEHAKKWKIHCVSLQWLSDGVENGYSCDEALYPPDSSEAECHTSTPVKEKRMSDFRDVNVSTISNISSFSNVDETALTIFNFTGVKGQVSSDAPMTLEGGLRALEELKLDRAHERPFLDGCTIYFSDFTADLVEKVRRVINAGGGTRLSQLNEAVTHILVADRITQNLRNFHSKAPEVYILNSLWLVDSYSDGQRQPEERYFLPEFTKDETILEDEEAVIPKEHIRSSSKIDDQQPDMLFNQYRPVEGEDGDGEIEFPPKDEDKSLDEDETVMETAGTDGMFANKIFTILGFNPEETENIQSQIMDANGKILTDSSRAIPDFAVVPLEGCEVKRTVGEVVTICWLEMCKETEMFLPTGGNFLFRPVVLSSRTEPLSDCVVTFSQYSGVEKQYLNQLAEHLGATCQDYFQRKAKKGSKANTHLILRSPEGSKHEASKKWGLPSVTTEWIFQCAKEGQRVPEERFLVDGDATQDNDESTKVKAANKLSPEFPVTDDILTINPLPMDVEVTPTHATSTRKTDAFKTPNIGILNLNSAKRPCSNSLEKSAKKLRRGEFGRIETPMPGTPATPGMFLRASQDFLPKLGIDTPVSVKPNRRKSSLPYEVCFYENLTSAVEVTGHGKIKTDESSNKERKEFSDKENETKSEVLHGLVLYVAEKLSHQRGELHKLIKSLGGVIKWSLDANCSHFIYQGKINDKELRRARKSNLNVVNPEWLSACKEAKRRIDEKLYPHTLNPNMSLSLSRVQMNKDAHPSPKPSMSSTAAPSVSPSPQTRAAMEVMEDQDISMEEEELMIAEAEAIEEKENSANSDEQREEFQRQFAQIMSTSGNQGSSKRRGRRQSGSTDGSNKEGNGSTTESKRSSRRLTRSRRESKVTKTKTHSKDKAVEPDSDPSCVITWDDASSRVCRENALARLRGEGIKEGSYEDEDQQKAEVKEFTELGNFHTSNETEESPSKVKTPPPIRLPHTKPAVAPERTEEDQYETNQVPIKRVFLFTGLTEQERIDYGALIEQLGGEVADKTYYDRSCTHMIVGIPSKNEKYLAAIASGKWILHRSYMVECQKAGRFIEEAPHELNASMFPEKMSRASVLGHAPKRWREQLQQEDVEHHGAFDGWKVLMIVEEAKEKGLKRILEAGCGVVLATRLPFPTSRSEATHLFLSTSKLKGVEETIDYEELVSNGTLCLRPEYIAEFIIKSPSPDPSLFLLSDVKSILERIANETTQSAVATRSGSLQRGRSRESTSSISSSKKSRHR